MRTLALFGMLSLISCSSVQTKKASQLAADLSRIRQETPCEQKSCGTTKAECDNVISHIARTANELYSTAAEKKNFLRCLPNYEKQADLLKDIEALSTGTKNRL